ncbi:hypothetical protein [Vibrio paucivorans]
MHDFCHRIVDINDSDFQQLTYELSGVLSVLTNDSGNSSFNQDAFDSNSDAAIVVYSSSHPVACGVFRLVSEQICELKRMYSKQVGAGGYLLLN